MQKGERTQNLKKKFEKIWERFYPVVFAVLASYIYISYFRKVKVENFDDILSNIVSYASIIMCSSQAKL